jgi:hypothetical protein
MRADYGDSDEFDQLVETFLHDGLVRLPAAVDLAAGSRLDTFLQQTLSSAGLWDGDALHSPPGLTSLPPTSVANLAAVAPRLWRAVCRLLGGADRIRRPARLSNALICNFRTTSIAHIDGDFFVHYPDSPEQALLLFVLWSNIAPGEGATEVAPAATADILQFLAQHPEGRTSAQIPTRDFVGATYERVFLTGRAGDAWLLHPCTAHQSTPNPNSPPRLISNPVVALRAPLRLADNATPTPLEKLTLRLLGGEFRHAIPARRRSFVPERINRWRQQGLYTDGDPQPALVPPVRQG